MWTLLVLVQWLRASPHDESCALSSATFEETQMVLQAEAKRRKEATTIVTMVSSPPSRPGSGVACGRGLPVVREV